MRFAELKEKMDANIAEEHRLRLVGLREWLCPDGSKIEVQISPQYVDMISINFYRWVKQEGATTTLRNGRVLEGGYHDHVYEAIRTVSAQHLDWITKARLMCERYVEGFNAELPDTLF